MSAVQILEQLSQAIPMKLADLPDDYGIYALWDHTGQIRYIGCTTNLRQGFRKRIYGRHTTGSEGYSHKFSHFYCTGRMWREGGRGTTEDRVDSASYEDAKIAKKLRAAFIRTYCRATVASISREVEEDDTSYADRVLELEREVHTLAPLVMRSWEHSACPIEHEPVDLVDVILAKNPEWKAACERQARRSKEQQRPQPWLIELVVDQLSKLAKLHENGRLDLADFTALKKKLIDL